MQEQEWDSKKEYKMFRLQDEELRRICGFTYIRYQDIKVSLLIPKSLTNKGKVWSVRVYNSEPRKLEELLVCDGSTGNCQCH